MQWQEENCCGYNLLDKTDRDKCVAHVSEALTISTETASIIVNRWIGNAYSFCLVISYEKAGSGYGKYIGFDLRETRCST